MYVEKVMGDPFSKYVLNTYYVLDSTVSAQDTQTAINKINIHPHGAYILVEEDQQLTE